MKRLFFTGVALAALIAGTPVRADNDPASVASVKAFYADFEDVAREKMRLHQHPGIELLFVISGKLEIIIGSDPHELSAGDAIYFDSGVRHGYRRTSKTPCMGVVVTA